jgi:hypothetical protein
MHSRVLRRNGAVTFALLAAFVAASAALRPRATALRPAPVETQLDIPPLPVDVLGPFSFGFRSVVSDVMFLEAIQVLGANHSFMTLDGGAPYDRQLARLIQYATDLDPQFAGAYRFAGNALPRPTLDGHTANVIPAVQILERGVRERPDDWHISFVLGYLQAFQLGEFRQAAANLAHAARLRGSPAYLGLLATRLEVEGGDLDAAETMAQTMVAEASEDQTRDDWEARLLDIRMERGIRRIEAAARAFEQRTGRKPRSVEELVGAGDLSAVPEEPHGKEYVIENGEVRSTAGPRPRLRAGVRRQ